MISSPWFLLLVGAVGASLTMVGVWLVSIRIANASYVDVAWALGIAATGRRLRAARGKGRRACAGSRRRPRHDLGRTARHLSPLPSAPARKKRALPGCAQALGAAREPGVLRLLPGAGASSSSSRCRSLRRGRRRRDDSSPREARRSRSRVAGEMTADAQLAAGSAIPPTGARRAATGSGAGRGTRTTSSSGCCGSRGAWPRWPRRPEAGHRQPRSCSSSSSR